jgi:hypothetical protein
MIPVLTSYAPEEAVLKGRSMYTWYKATKKFKLVRKGKEYIVKPGDSVGVRAAGSAKDKMRLVLDSLGVNKVFSFFTADWPKMKKNLKAASKKNQQKIIKVSTPHTDLKAMVNWDAMRKAFKADPELFVKRVNAVADAFSDWYSSSSYTDKNAWDMMGWFRHFFVLPKQLVWAYRGTKLYSHGKKVKLKKGDLVKLNTVGKRPFQSWSHDYDIAEGFHDGGNSDYLLKAQIPTKFIVACPATMEAIKNAAKVFDKVSDQYEKIVDKIDTMVSKLEKQGKSTDKLEERRVQYGLNATLYSDLSYAFENLYDSYDDYREEREIIFAASAMKSIRCEILKAGSYDEDY